MVDFNTRIFSEDDGKIIGAEITVYSGSGDNLGSISVADATTLAEMQAQLALIDETYFTEERLAEILVNINESQEINATQLSGFLSSDFAKVSQLSNYAPLSHNHSVSQITGLYDYQITASNYNVNIDSTVNIIVKVINRATGNPVVGVPLSVLKNNETWQSGTTGVNGTFSLTYTADSWGLVTFSVNGRNIQIRVTGWKKIGGNTNYGLWVNEETKLLRMRLNIPSRSYAQGHQTVLSAIIPNKYLNDTNVNLAWRQDTDLRIDTSGNLKAYCATAFTDGMYMWCTWSYGTSA